MTGDRGVESRVSAERNEAAAFDYSFSVWPLEQACGGQWELSTYDLFRMYPRVWMAFTEDAWNDYRSSLERQGFTIRECERQPHHEPEMVA